MQKPDVATPDAAPAADLIAVTEQLSDGPALALTRARSFAQPLIAGEALDSGENTLDHADAVAAILKQMGALKPCRLQATWSMPATT
jgi:GTP pyrophosphokinase